MKNYFLCSEEVTKHFPLLEKSKPFKSGYDWDKDIYFIIVTEHYQAIEKYYNEVVEPFNEKSTIDDLDFWLREVSDSQLSNAPRGCSKTCKDLGVFMAIENIWNLTNARNRAYAIFKMADFYGLNPIEFIDSVVKHQKLHSVAE